MWGFHSGSWEEESSLHFAVTKLFQFLAGFHRRAVQSTPDVAR